MMGEGRVMGWRTDGVGGEGGVMGGWRSDVAGEGVMEWVGKMKRGRGGQ